MYAQKVYEASSIPPPTQEQLRTLLSTDPRHREDLESRTFYEQAWHLVQVTDDAPYTEDFFKIRPTYSSFTHDQMRGYFTWRDAFRRGKIQPAPFPFALLYCSEVVNLVGIDNVMQGLRTLLTLAEHCTTINPLLRVYLTSCLQDYILAYDLDTSLLDKFTLRNQVQDEFSIFRPTTDLSTRIIGKEDEVFSALTKLSRYAITKSAFYARATQQLTTLVSRVVAQLWDSHKKTHNGAPLFGGYTRSPYQLFKLVHFYERAPHHNAQYILPDGSRYTCSNNAWTFEWWYPEKPCQLIGDILKTCEARLRKAFGYRHALKEPLLPDNYSVCIDQEIARLVSEERTKRTQAISIDRSKLKSIRATAEVTQEKLLTEEERAQEEKTEPQVQASMAHTNGPLSPEEINLLTRLVAAKAGLRSKELGTIADLFADAINEKLFDLVQDTVLVVEDGCVRVLTEYDAQVKELLQQWSPNA